MNVGCLTFIFYQKYFFMIKCTQAFSFSCDEMRLLRTRNTHVRLGKHIERFPVTEKLFKRI